MNQGRPTLSVNTHDISTYHFANILRKEKLNASIILIILTVVGKCLIDIRTKIHMQSMKLIMVLLVQTKFCKQ